MQISSFPSSVRQIGSGVPQKRLRLRFQSWMFSSHWPKRPVPVEAGRQVIWRLSATISSFTAVALMNHESRG